MFITFVLLVFFLLASIIVEAAKNMIPKTSDELTEKEIAFINNFEKVNVRILEGDTSWVIQSSLAPNYDTRQILYYAEKLNGKSMGNILEGETLVFLKERED